MERVGAPTSSRDRASASLVGGFAGRRSDVSSPFGSPVFLFPRTGDTEVRVSVDSEVANFTDRAGACPRSFLCPTRRGRGDLEAKPRCVPKDSCGHRVHPRSFEFAPDRPWLLPYCPRLVFRP